jgi:hypothetical protein
MANLQSHSNNNIKELTKGLGGACFVLGFVSILASIAIWAMSKSPDPAHGERFGIFVGLWAPTFFILSDRFSRSKV